MKSSLALPIAVLFGLSGCMKKISQAPAPQTNLAVDNSYLDLVAGGKLRVVVPILKGGDTAVDASRAQTAGSTITLSAGNLLGYRVAYYFVEGRPHEQVRLRFIAAQITKDGKTDALPSEPALPFALPAKAQHIRLIYYIRASQSDHNMAIAGAKDLNVLAEFTKRFEANPGVCGSTPDVFCSWIPPGVAVRPE